MNRIRHVLTSLALLMFSTATALAVNISGIVKDAVTTEPLMEASVRLLAAKDSAFVKGISTDIDGRFRLQGVNKGKYIIAVTYIGYTDY